MANCLLNTLGCLWAFILGSLRIILFFGCLIMFLIELVGIIAVSNSSINIQDLPNYNVTTGHYLVNLVTLAVYLLGCYAAFYKHLPSLKVFVIIVFFTTLFQFLQLLNIIVSNNMQKRIDDLFNAMSKLMPNYNWEAIEGTSKANRAWDRMQKVFCCGIEGPDDWDKYRPSSMKKGQLPNSCCFPTTGMSCTTEKAFDIGCRKRWEQVQAFGILYFTIYIILQAVLFLIGLISLSSGNGCGSQRQSRSVASEEGQQQQPQQQVPGQYQKLNQSVYVRQPAYNPIAGDTNKGLSGIAYPDLTQQPGYQPPPSYGSRA